MMLFVIPVRLCVLNFIQFGPVVSSERVLGSKIGNNRYKYEASCTAFSGLREQKGKRHDVKISSKKEKLEMVAWISKAALTVGFHIAAAANRM